MTTAITTNGACMPSPAALPDLAEQINEEHLACASAMRTTLEHAQRCGDLLAEAKSRCAHGEWLPWLAENTEVTPRVAQRYMKAARHRAELEAKSEPESHLTMTEALGLLADASDDEEPEPNPDATADARKAHGDLVAVIQGSDEPMERDIEFVMPDGRAVLKTLNYETSMCEDSGEFRVCAVRGDRYNTRIYDHEREEHAATMRWAEELVAEWMTSPELAKERDEYERCQSELAEAEERVAVLRAEIDRLQEAAEPAYEARTEAANLFHLRINVRLQNAVRERRYGDG